MKKLAVVLLLLSCTAFATVAGTGSRVVNGVYELVSYLRLVGVATGSLPACNAARAGAVQYDTTTTTVKYCDGTRWTSFSAAASFTWDSFCTAATCGEGTGNLFTKPFYADKAYVLLSGANGGYVSAGYGTAGVNAGGGQGVFLTLRDYTASADTSCQVHLSDCTNGTFPNAGTCGSDVTLVVGHVYSWYQDAATDCTTDPGQIHLSAQLINPP